MLTVAGQLQGESTHPPIILTASPVQGCGRAEACLICHRAQGGARL